jgi:O-antigen/teichoic acid export membrane protein
LSSAATTVAQDRAAAMPPVLGRLMRGTFFLALKTPLQALIALVSIPLVQRYIGEGANGAYVFAWNFGFFQFLLEFGMSSALQREVSDAWTRGDRKGVDRAIACGMNFYAATALVQVAALLGVAYFVLPGSRFRGQPAELALAHKLLWLQAMTAPFFGLSAVVSSVLQAARRFDFAPRLDLLVVVLRFALLVLGYEAGVDFFLIVVAWTALQIGLLVGPGLWVMVRELDYVPRLGRVAWGDFAPLLRVGGYMFLIQLSVVLADKLDTTILAFALPDPGPATTLYQNVSKPFLQIRQTGWTLAYLVMPAVASLVAANDHRGLERIKYDGSRFLIGLLLPVALLAAIYAGPFLNFWVGPQFEKDAPLLRLFLVATVPLTLLVLSQMAMGLAKVDVIAVSALLGALVNLPISWFLTRRIGVAGVIWGTVLTTLVSNGLVPAIYLFRLLEVDVRTFLARTLSAPLAGASALVAATWVLRQALPAGPTSSPGWARFLPLFINLTVGVLAYLGGYGFAKAGRADLGRLAARLGLRSS